MVISAPPEQIMSTPYVVSIMRLTILIDKIAIALGVPIILVTADNRSGDAA